MDFVSQNITKDTFDGNMRLNPGENGEEYRLFGGILDLLQSSIRNKGVLPCCFGNCRFGERFTGAEPYLAGERKNIPGFPDFLYVNEQYVLCIDHTQINASCPRSNYENGDEYRAFLAKHADLLEQEHYEELEGLIAEEGLTFTPANLVRSLLRALSLKLPKVSQYKRHAYDYISTGINQGAVEEDLAKRMEAWLLIEDVTPTTSFESALSDDDVIFALESSDELEGLIYVHHPYPTRVPEISDVVFIHNDSCARDQLKLLATSSPEPEISI